MSLGSLSKNAFILAAGFGKRLRPHTANTPKPLVPVDGTPMIDQTIEKLKTVGIEKCIVNTHYLADQLHEHLSPVLKPQILCSHEVEILDTGGGIQNAIGHFDAPFFVVSGDSVWDDAKNQNTLQAMADFWDSEKMDILILLQPVNSMTCTKGVGDYDLNEAGKAIRSKDQTGKYMFTSIRINAPSIFNRPQGHAFSYLELLDEAQEKGRLYGLVHKGIWHHISTPQDLENVNNAYDSAA